MNYRVLPAPLAETADLVIDKYLKGELGLNSIRVESPIDPQIEFCPTLSAKRKDKHYVCVEVSEAILPLTIPPFILQCQQQHFPVLLYIAYPKGAIKSDYESQLRKARECGVGVIVVDHASNTCTVLSTPLSLSLTGLRRIEKKAVPQKYREQLVDAETTFRSGEPNKACSKVYDEVEGITRRAAFKTYSKGYWKKTIKAPDNLRASMSWTSVLEALKENIDRKRAKAAGHDLDKLTTGLINQALAIVPHRNESSHKPKSLKALRERDAKLRTRMESAVDLLCEWINATRCLRI